MRCRLMSARLYERVPPHATRASMFERIHICSHVHGCAADRVSSACCAGRSSSQDPREEAWGEASDRHPGESIHSNLSGTWLALPFSSHVIDYSLLALRFSQARAHRPLKLQNLQTDQPKVTYMLNGSSK